MMIQGKDGNWYSVPDSIFGDRDGRTFSPALDRFALDTQSGLTFLYMSTHEWVTPAEVAEAIGWGQWDHGSVTARFRDFRKAKFGGFTVERRRVKGSNRLHEYRLMEPEEDAWPQEMLDEPPSTQPATPSSPTSTAPRVMTVVPRPSRPPSTAGWRIVPSSP
jgi:hypothetical protein